MNKRKGKIVNKFKQIIIGCLFYLMAFDAMALVSPPAITGTLQMIGATYMIDASGNITSDATSAVTIDFTPNLLIATSADGDFAGLVNQVGSIQNLQFDSFASPIANFWSIDIFSFELTDVLVSSMNTDSSSFLSIEGGGILSAVGFSDTDASWSFTSNSAGDSQFG